MNQGYRPAAMTDGLLLFAPDHAFTCVTPLAGSPPYSLPAIDDVPGLTAWIEGSPGFGQPTSDAHETADLHAGGDIAANASEKC